MRVVTRSTVSERLLGRTLEVELRLDGKRSEWWQISGRVLRVGFGALALELDTVPPAFVQFVDDNSSDAHHHRRLLWVVVVDATATRRHAIAKAFRDTGCSVIEVATPLEAIVRLGEAQFEPDLIVIADSVPSSTSNELRAFVEREHPGAALITVNDDAAEPAGLVHWLSSANPENDLVGRVRDVVSRALRTS